MKSWIIIDQSFAVRAHVDARPLNRDVVTVGPYARRDEKGMRKDLYQGSPHGVADPRRWPGGRAPSAPANLLKCQRRPLMVRQRLATDPPHPSFF